MDESIVLGNCPECGHFPTQFVGDDTRLDYVIHLPDKANCKAGPHDYIQNLENGNRIKCSERLQAELIEVYQHGDSADHYNLIRDLVHELGLVPDEEPK